MFSLPQEMVSCNLLSMCNPIIFRVPSNKYDQYVPSNQTLRSKDTSITGFAATNNTFVATLIIRTPHYSVKNGLLQ